MDLLSKMGEKKTKKSPGGIIEHYTTIHPEKHDSSREKRMSSLRESEWAVAESQKGMTQDEVKIASHWKWNTLKNGRLLRGMFELFSGWWVSSCWVRKRDDVRWSENCMSRCNSMKTGIFLRGRIELFAGGWVGCYWNRKERWPREWDEWLQDRRKK